MMRTSPTLSPQELGRLLPPYSSFLLLMTMVVPLAITAHQTLQPHSQANEIEPVSRSLFSPSPSSVSTALGELGTSASSYDESFEPRPIRSAGKKPKSVISSLLTSNGSPSYAAQVSSVIEPGDPCYNFTIGNQALNQFFSPSFPEKYPNRTECERIIRAPHGHQIIIEFRDQFKLEESTDCEYDYLEVRDGAFGYSNRLVKLCGTQFPKDIVSNDRYLFLRFVSDDSIEEAGFKAVYSFKKSLTQRPEPPHECHFNRTGVSGIILNTEIPNELAEYSVQNNVPLDCMWNITVEPGYKMYINFKEYKLSSPNNCEVNYIDIYGEKLSDMGRKQRFCGTQAESVRSDGNHMNIRFFAKNDALKNALFEITFTAFRELPNKEKCRADEFDCEDSTCIAASLKCDNIENCKYRYDEDKQTTCAPGNKGMLNLNSQHMVIILIVFCALVFGMCASITISCWSKIEERRQRKREYKLRRSRETSMEVGLDRTMTITSLDRAAGGAGGVITSTGGMEHLEQGSSSSSSRCRKIITANQIRPGKEMVMLDEDGCMVDGGGGPGSGPTMAFYDSEENGCYVPEMELAGSGGGGGGGSRHHHLVYPTETQQPRRPNGGPSYSLDKYSPDTPTPPHHHHHHLHQTQQQAQHMLTSPTAQSSGLGNGGAREYYQPGGDHGSIRSDSECSIPPPPPPPALSHFRGRLVAQGGGGPMATYRTLPLDASKLNDGPGGGGGGGPLVMGDNPTLYRHSQHMPQQRMLHHPGQQQSSGQPGQQQHHPDCAQHQLNKQQHMMQPSADSGYNSNSLRRSAGASTPTVVSYTYRGTPTAGAANEILAPNDIDIMVDEGGGGGGQQGSAHHPLHHRSNLELTGNVGDEGLDMGCELFSDSELMIMDRGAVGGGGGGYGNGRSCHTHHPPYLLRTQSTMEEEEEGIEPLDEDESSSLPLGGATNANGGDPSCGPGQYTTLTHTPNRPMYYRSEAVIEMSSAGGGGGAPGGGAPINSNLSSSTSNLRQGVAMMR